MLEKLNCDEEYCVSGGNIISYDVIIEKRKKIDRGEDVTKTMYRYFEPAIGETDSLLEAALNDGESDLKDHTLHYKLNGTEGQMSISDSDVERFNKIRKPLGELKMKKTRLKPHA